MKRKTELVSVSYRSYILSYVIATCEGVIFQSYDSFRLLSELYSFLYFGLKLNKQQHELVQFPSPIGVIFFLINVGDKSKFKKA